MKHIILTTIFVLLLGVNLNAQEEQKDSTAAETKTKTDTVETKTETDTETDTVKISWGKTRFFMINSDWANKSDSSKKRKQRYNHFAGIDIGVNGLLTDKNSVDLTKEGEFMDLNYGKSISVALNFWEWYGPIYKEKIGLSTGLGVEFNNYRLDRDIDIITTTDTTFGVQNTAKKFEKNIFKSTMLNLPVFLETNIGRKASQSFHLAVGGQISYRLGSKTKQIFEDNDERFKVKYRNDYNMNDFRFNAVARIGYGDFTLFASYSLTPMFKKDKGPELYPFTVGVSMLSW